MASEQSNNESNPYSTIDDVEVRKTPNNDLAIALMFLSLLLYIVACALPLHLDDIHVNGITGLIVGWAVLWAWIPNPLFFIGFVFAIMRRYTIATFLALLACVWSIAVVASGEFGGPAPTYWVISMITLAIASITGSVRSKR